MPPWARLGQAAAVMLCAWLPAPRGPRSLQDEPLLVAEPQCRSPGPGASQDRSGWGGPLGSATSLTEHTLSLPPARERKGREVRTAQPFLHLGPRTGPARFILWPMSCQTKFLFIDRPGDGQVSPGPRLHSCTRVCCPWSHPVLARLLGQSYQTPPKHQEGGRRPRLLVLGFRLGKGAVC